MSMSRLADVQRAIEYMAKPFVFPEYDQRRQVDLKYELQRLSAECLRREQEGAVLSAFVTAVLNEPGMTAERLAEIAELDSKASPGPWKLTIHKDWEPPHVRVIDGPQFDEICYGRGGDHFPQSDANCEFITDARQAVPELLSEVLRLRAMEVSVPI